MEAQIHEDVTENIQNLEQNIPVLIPPPSPRSEGNIHFTNQSLEVRSVGL